MEAKQAVVVRNQFANKNARGVAKGSIKYFVEKYVTRPEAVEPLVVDDNQQADYLQLVDDLHRPDDLSAQARLNEQLKYDGVAFNAGSLAMSRQEQIKAGDRAQAAYDRGATVRQMVLSFDSQWLSEQGILDEQRSVWHRGDFAGHVDELRLRQVVQSGMERFFAQTKMKEPEYVAAVQVDTSHVHVHLVTWDEDPSVINDRGQVNGYQKDALRSGVIQRSKETTPYAQPTAVVQAVAAVKEQNARFERTSLDHLVEQAAQYPSEQSVTSYLQTLSRYEAQQLSGDGWRAMSRQIQADLAATGTAQTVKPQQDPGPRRAARQNKAFEGALNIRQEMQEFNEASVAGLVDPTAWAVKQAMNTEWQHQMLQVEKYRQFQRPQTAALYHRHEKELKARREALLKRREDLLQRAPNNRVAAQAAHRALADPAVLAVLKQNEPDKPLHQTKAYQELSRLQTDLKYPLSTDTLNLLKHRKNDDGQTESLVETLSRNQQVPVAGTQRTQPSWWQEYWAYLADLDEYQMDAVTWGGMSATQLQLSGENATWVAVPPATQSIYERTAPQNTPAVMAVDAHQLVDDFDQLKPVIQSQVKQQHKQRTVRLQNAYRYFQDTAQTVPDWMNDALRDWNVQHRQLPDQATTGPTVTPPDPDPAPAVGYQLPDQQRDRLVQKHLRTLRNLQHQEQQNEGLDR